MMKLVLVVVTFIVISIGTCHGFPEGLEDPNSTEEPQPLTDGTWARFNSDSEDHHLRDGNDIVTLDNEDQLLEGMEKGKERELRKGDTDKKILNLVKVIQKTQDSKLADMSSAIANISTKLGSLKGGCPKGLFYYAPTDQCFMMLNDTTHTWSDADKACHSKGLVLAHPYDPEGIRSYIITKYGDYTWTWVDAKGTGSCVKYQRSSRCIGSSNPLWYYRYASTSYCLALMTTAGSWKSYGIRLYYTTTCTSKYLALCELPSE